MLVSVAFVDAKDQLLTDLAREVEIDVGHALESLVQEAAQLQIGVDGVDVGEPDQVADDRGDGGAAPPARRQGGVGPRCIAAYFTGYVARQIHDVAIDQEEAREAVQVDEPEFVVEPSLRLLFLLRAREVPLRDLRQTDRSEGLECSTSVAPLEVGKLVAEVAREVEGAAALGDLERSSECVGAAFEASGHHLGRGEVTVRIGAAPRMRSVERGPVANRHQDVLKAVPLGPMHMDVVRRHDRQAHLVGQPPQHPIPSPVSARLGILQLHVEMARLEGVEEAPCHLFALRPAPFQRGYQR